MTTTSRLPSLRRAAGADRVTDVELFFDLVYVFAVTQLSHLLVEHPTVRGGVQTAVLLAVVWQVWVYTTWTTNYLDPGRTLVRGLLLALMFGSLLLAAAIPEAFHQHGMLVAVTFTCIQVGRSLVSLLALRGEEDLRMVYVRILPWSVVTSVLMVVGALEHGDARIAVWAVAVSIELVGAAFGFWLPGVGGSATTDWQISGGHFAERCQAFVLIALGESVVVIGGLAKLDDPHWRDVVAAAGAFAGVVGLWWIYFDRAAAESAQVIESSDDPGRLARSAFHWGHPVIIAGIIATAAADEKILEHPGEHGRHAVAWLTLGGVGLFLAGHALFKALVWRVVSWPRVIAVVALALLGLVSVHVSALVTGLCALAVIVCVGLADRIGHPLDDAA